MIGGNPATHNNAKREDVQPNEENHDGDEEDDDDFLDDYTIDLGALGEKPSSVVVEDRKVQRDVVDSEDDGPPDFTLNLEKWMRGTEKWEKETDTEVAEDDANPGGGLQNDVQAGESVFEPVGASTPGPLTKHAIFEEGVQEEARFQAPTLSRLNTETLQEKAAEEVFDRIAALQAEVERMRLEEESRRLAHQALEQKHEKLKREHGAASERDQASYDALYQEHKQLKQSYHEARESLQQENNHLKQNYNDAIEQLQVLAQDSPTDHGTKTGESIPLSEPIKQESAIVKAKAEADALAADTRLKALSAELRTFQEESFALRAEIESIQETHNTKIKGLNAELEARQNEVALERKESVHRANEAVSLTDTISQKDKELYALNGEIKLVKMELEHAQEQLTETRRILETVEDENDRLLQQNDQQAEDIADLKLTLKTNRRESSTVTEVSKETQEVPEAIEPDTIDKATHEAALEALRQQHQTTLSSLAATDGKKVSILRSALLKASQAMQKRESKLIQTHRKEVAALRQELGDSKGQSKKPASSSLGLENELRSAIRVLSKKLERANALLAATRAEAADARQKAEDVRTTNATINAELEARFAETVEAREKEWRRRISLLFRERDRMGKALMWGWGREEMGPKTQKEKEQPYRYKHFTK